MAAVQPTSPEAFLLDLFPPGTIRRAGRRLGCYLRVRKIDVLALVLVVVLTVCGRGEQPIAEMRRELERRTGVFVVRSSFWARSTQAQKRSSLECRGGAGRGEARQGKTLSLAICRCGAALRNDVCGRLLVIV